jgi:putative transposase
MTRSLQDVQLCALLVDGTCFKGESLVVAMGIDRLGNKLVLGLVQGATENAAVIGDLFCQLEERGLDFGRPRLYVIDGSRALPTAIQRHAGEAAFIQRCQVHKLRNVAEYLPEAERGGVKFRMRAAYALPEAVDARNMLYKLHDELMRSNPSAADSLAEGLEETFTLQELGVRGKLRRSFSSSNIIESGFATVERICTQVKRWHGGDQRLRWVASALL